MSLGIITVLSIIGVLTLLISAFVNGTDKKETMENELKCEKILEYLPGDNCGACGCRDCADLAMKIAKGEAPASACLSGGAATAQAVGVLMGKEELPGEPLRAQVMCSCSYDSAKIKYEYDSDSGYDDCSAVMNLGGGEKSCRFACIGMGSCVKSCPYHAISIESGIASVDYRKCTGCGICKEACPKKLIEMIPYDTYYWVGCSSREKGKKTKINCRVGCTGCGACEKVCPENAVSVKDHIAKIDYSLCTGCGRCFSVCPEGIIWKADAVGASDLVFTKGK